MTDYPLSKLST